MTTRNPTPSQPCTGVRVIELSAMISGPYCAQMLASVGAEVIKVEPPGGDLLRQSRPVYRDMGALFTHHNRGKRSIGIDLTNEEGRKLAQDLIAGADVVVENFRPGVMQKLGLGYEEMSRRNPRLIHVSITGYGLDGPYVKRPAYDQAIQALSGYCWIQGNDGKPEAVRSTIVDRLSGVTAYHGVLAALLHRERTGVGQLVSVPLLDAYAAVILPGSTNNETFLDADLPHYQPRNIYQPIATRDGYVMGHIQTDAQFEAAARLFKREDLIADPRFKGVGNRLSHIEELWGELAISARAMGTDEVIALCVANDVPINRVNRVQDLMVDPQALHNETFFDYEDPEYGRLRQLNFPVKFSAGPKTARVRAPKFGEHTADILRAAGVSDEQAEKLRSSRVVF
ncbi:MAG TPA: CoA transferase [Ramlibacter sp.]|uniref:CaiB/BaiF CoA transferase family protein n=1 Tax=Ramlibacter sp. TaxID=1917967 RepID=UPI002C9DB1D0|nr:CoA transferase [Ramlibacter sp.]HVZ45814.1 CoA transferase [Ramlibacter sp.]